RVRSGQAPRGISSSLEFHLPLGTGSAKDRSLIPSLRRAYNAAFTQQKYDEYRRRLEEQAGCRIEFRLCEAPVFLPPELRDEMVRAATEIWDELSTPENLRRSVDAVPPSFDVSGCPDHPTFAQADFAVTWDRPGGTLVPKLIELQAFPSLYAFQLFQTNELARITPGGENLGFLLSGLDEHGYVRSVGDAILGDFPPDNVVLMDIDPPSQKTFVDFALTEKLWRVRAVSVTDIEKRGRELWYRRDGRATRILRIYNRLIFDELLGKGISIPIDFREPLDVSWAGHPNWYFRWSKHSLPVLRHPAVPEARLLSDLAEPPKDLEKWVLKPLFSFAGSGVKVDVTRADLDAVAEEERPRTLLMRKVDYAPVVETTDGGASKVEVRVMFIWRDGQPFPVTTLARLSQGTMMGVAFNKDRTWVGSSGCLWPQK
ncbi:MAG TPA: hypothetical protein VGB47_06690, partial [Thermoanaerobaculia bacterium]